MMTIRITRPSLSWNSKENTNVNNLAKQQIACKAAKEKFMGEIAAGADVAFYIGHSRDGGGPDFCSANDFQTIMLITIIIRLAKRGLLLLPMR